MRISHSAGVSSGLNASYKNQRVMGKTLTKLATGLRINGASDDAAGLAISENLRSQVRGSIQARKNTLDGISMLNIAEGGANEVASILQRGRELAVQSASEALTNSERKYLQQELGQLTKEIDRISNNTQFNGINVLSGSVDPEDAEAITKGLQDSWLEQSEKLIDEQYGLTAVPGENLDIKLESNGAGGVAAYVQYTTGTTGGTDISLNIDVDDFIPIGDENGGTAPMYSDRIIAHEMVHAVMASTMDTSKLSTWFMEGAAEMIHGADERVKTDLESYSAQDMVDMITDGGWASDSAHYSGAYLAVRFIKDDVGGAAGFKQFMEQLDQNNGDLDATFLSETSYVDEDAFLTDFKTRGGNINSYGVDLDDVVTGAIGRSVDAKGAVPNTLNNTTDPLLNFAENWDTSSEPRTLQIGANSESEDLVDLVYGNIYTTSIGVDNLDISTASAAQSAIGVFDEAIATVSKVRADIGSYVNRLEHTVNHLITSETNQQAAESLIRDVDFAAMSAAFTKQQILSEASNSMLAQANQQRNAILSLSQ